MSSITLHLEVWLGNRPSDWLIPSDYCVMLQQTKWEGVVQMILRNCVYLVQNRPNFTFIWVISVYVVLGQPAVPAQFVDLILSDIKGANGYMISVPLMPCNFSLYIEDGHTFFFQIIQTNNSRFDSRILWLTKMPGALSTHQIKTPLHTIFKSNWSKDAVGMLYDHLKQSLNLKHVSSINVLKSTYDIVLTIGENLCPMTMDTNTGESHNMDYL